MRSAVSIRSSFLFFTWKYALLSFIIHILQQDEEKEQREESRFPQKKAKEKAAKTVHICENTQMK